MQPPWSWPPPPPPSPHRRGSILRGNSGGDSSADTVQPGPAVSIQASVVTVWPDIFHENAQYILKMRQPQM